MVGAVLSGAAAAHRAETVVIAVLVVDVCALHFVADIGLLRPRSYGETVIGKLDGPYSGIAAEAAPEKVELPGLLVAYDIGVNGVGDAL